MCMTVWKKERKKVDRCGADGLPLSICRSLPSTTFCFVFENQKCCLWALAEKNSRCEMRTLDLHCSKKKKMLESLFHMLFIIFILKDRGRIPYNTSNIHSLFRKLHFKPYPETWPRRNIVVLCVYFECENTLDIDWLSWT